VEDFFDPESHGLTWPLRRYFTIPAIYMSLTLICQSKVGMFNNIPEILV